MNGRRVLIAISLVVCCSTALTQTVSEADYVKGTLSHCTAHLYRLILCLSDNKPLLFEMKKCDNVLTQTFICLASSRSGSPLTHALPESEDNGGFSMLKRGLGQCIHRCLNGQGRMNFIQCKSMCHR
ncbi:uncharacterized protein LOC123542547 [Mercenaria mercenaria]|uniref:uncharacterized protein LOC123542547 n=1 Tax=Mercenaria mercenaria TaxID=6596 RepID=UPI00234E6B88|nr:uncharacterized protein LOC123542547 [Mercenaria mercenaria]